MIKLEVVTNKLFLRFSGPDFKQDLEFIKTLDGRSFRKDGKDNYWVAPLTIHNINKIKQKSSYFESIKALDSADLTLFKPREKPDKYHLLKQLKKWIKEKIPFLRKYQARDVGVCLISGNILNANEMGLGKTIESLAVIYLCRKFRTELKGLFDIEVPAYRVLIVCPSSLKFQWRNEAKLHFDLNITVINGTKDQRAKQWSALHNLDKEFIIATNYENLATDDLERFKLDKIVFDIIFADEITKVKNIKTTNYKRLRLLNSRKFIGLTGTPIENHLLDIYTIMTLINPNFYESYEHFTTKYLYHGGYGGALIPKPGAAQWLADDLKNFWGFIRWKREAVLKDLPEMIPKVYSIELTKEERERYNSIKNERLRVKGQNGVIDLSNPLTKMQVLLRLCSDPAIYCQEQKDSAKKKEFLRIVKDTLNGKKIVVFSKNKDVIRSYARTLRNKQIPTMVITGDTEIEERQKIIDRFRESEQVKIMLCTDALAWGANLQFCSTLINIDMHWNPAIIKQRIGRIHRIGQQAKTLLIVNFTCNQTVEEKVYKHIFIKEKIFDTIITANELAEECLND